MMSKTTSIDWYLTSSFGERVQCMPLVFPVSCMLEDIPVVTVDTQDIKQSIDGFGGTFNEAGWQLLSALDSDARDSVLKAFFDHDCGAGYSLCAAPIGHNDFSLDYYSYDECPDDTDLKDFSIKRDKDYLLPYIKSARQFGSFRLVCRPDYPPAWMLDAQKSIPERYFPAFAKYISKYITAYEQEGVIVDWVSLFNEPRIYMNITPMELKILLRDHVGPLLGSKHPDVKIQLCDSYNRDQAIFDYAPTLEDPEARKYLDGIAYHSYSWDQTSIQNIKKLHDSNTDLRLWQTEVMHLYTKPFFSFADGEVWGKLIMDDLSAGASGWIFWNMVLDENGGPWNQSKFNTGYPQDAVAVINQSQHRVTYTAKYYYQSHFSRFIVPGSARLGYHVSKDNHPFPENSLYWLRILPFSLPDGKNGVVIMNTNDYEQIFYLDIASIQFKLTLPAHSIATYLCNLEAGAA